MKSLSEINAMVVPKERPQFASIPSQSMASACTSAVDNVARASTGNNLATNMTATSKASIRTGEAKVSNSELIAAATSSSTAVRKDIRETSAITMTDGEVAKAVEEMPEKTPFSRYYEKWEIPPGQSGALERFLNFNHSSVAPSKKTSPSYIPIEKCALWISEVKDDATRSRLTKWAMSRMEKAGIDSVLNAKPLHQHQASSDPVKKGTKREKNDNTLLFDDMIETSTFVLSKACKLNIKITKKEFQATGASIDAVNLRIATADSYAAGKRLFEDYVQTLEHGRISVSDWKNCTTMTDANPHGRDLLVYALHEVQLAKDDIKQLKGYLPTHKAPIQKKNTNSRIADCSARINHWLALAVELDKVRPKDEIDVDEKSEAGSETTSAPAPVREIRQDECVKPMSSITSQEDEKTPHKNVLLSNPKLKVPYDSVQDGRPVTPKTPTVQRVRSRPPKPPTDADGQHKQDVESKRPLQATRRPKRTRSVVADLDDSDDSDGEFKIEEFKPATKRTKTNDEARTKSPEKQPPVTPSKQTSGIPASTRSSSTNVAHSIRALSETDKQSREIYLRKHFLPIVNAILKKAGLGHMRVVPKEWDIIKRKLEDAKVPAKYRNELLRQFKSGWAHTPSLQSDHSVTDPSNKQNSSALLPAAATASTDIAPKDGLVVTLRVYEGFDPAEYSANSIFVLPGYRYRFRPESTIQERIQWASIIEQNVAAIMRGESLNGEWTRVYGQYKPVSNEWGQLVAEGFWDEFNGGAAVKGAWLWGGEES